MSYPRQPRLGPDVIIFGFIIVVVRFVVILIGAALGLWPLLSYAITREKAPSILTRDGAVLAEIGSSTPR